MRRFSQIKVPIKKVTYVTFLLFPPSRKIPGVLLNLPLKGLIETLLKSFAIKDTSLEVNVKVIGEKSIVLTLKLSVELRNFIIKEKIRLISLIYNRDIWEKVTITF